MTTIYRLFLLGFFGLLLTGCSSESTDVKPNIILILSDDQGWGDLSSKGNPNIQTPNIDKLAQTGVTFDRFYVCPVCSPTRAEILTGRYHVRGGVWATSTGGERLDLDETTIADVFKNAGYATAAYGKWHNGMQPPYHPNARGFDDYYGFCSGHWGNYFSPMLEHNGEIVTGNGYVTDDFTDHGLDFMEKNRNNPFFLYLPFNIPHSPNQVPDEWWDKFETRELTFRNRDPEREDLIQTRAALAMCENIDWNVGRITKKVEELGLSENTIIIYLSDNGPNTWRWNDGMKGRKGSTDEGGVRSPLIMKWENNFKAGKKITQIASALDFLPTLAELAGIEFTPAKPLDGKSVVPLLLDDNPVWEDRLIFNHWRGRTSVRTQQFRMDFAGNLFDMVEDPGQLNNISEKEPEVAKKLSTAIENWRQDVFSELPEEDNRPFTIGHPDFNFTQIPARDGIATGEIERSDNSPNCTFHTNWVNTEDSIYWNTEVLTTGSFDVELYYTCAEKNVGTVIELSLGKSAITKTITASHDPPLKGMENDRTLRTQSYVKDWAKISMGTIQLEKGMNKLTLKALDIPGEKSIDFRLLMLKRI